MARCIVTGGAGFIGSHLVDALVKRREEVIVIDNLSTGDRANVNSAAELKELDILSSEICPLFVGVDYVFHLAALARVVPSIVNPKESNEINVSGTINVLVAARDAKVKKVIYAASSSAYGDPQIIPTPESHPINPKSPYALQKYIGEQYCRLFSQLYQLPTVCLRFFNVYGSRQPGEGAYAMAISIFMKQRQQNLPMTIVGDGEQRRDFIHVSDIVSGLLAAANSAMVDGTSINLGTGKSYSINEVATLISGPTTPLPFREGEAKATLADYSLAKKLLAWQPQVKFEDGLAELKKLYSL